MKLMKILILSLLIQLSFFSNAQAGDFGWLDSLSIDARIDPSGIKTKIGARFHIGDAKVSAVIGDVGGHANAYMVFRLAEMSHMPVDTVIRQYHVSKGKGWGVLAKRLGIKPGSHEFHTLKRGHDLHGGSNTMGDKSKSKGKGKGKGKGKK